MKVELVPGTDLSSAQVAAWRAARKANAALDSPYFAPEFTQAVAAVRSDVWVGICEAEGRAPAAFFPFQRGTRGRGRPVGGIFSDFHGVIAPEEFTWDVRSLMRACGLSHWRFEHLPACQTCFTRHALARGSSPLVDLADGFEAYVARQPRKRREHFAAMRRKLRKMEREQGPVRVEPYSADPNALPTLLAWKSKQYAQSGAVDLFRARWTVELLERIAVTQCDDLQGVLSVLWVGERIAAIQMGMRSGEVMHYWFPAYNPELAPYSPGQALLLRLLEIYAEDGVRRVDLGWGDESYKRRFMTGEAPLLEGCVELRPGVHALRAAWRQTRSWLKASPLRAPARIPGRIAYRLRQRRELR